MLKRRLGASGLEVSALGFGCMGLSSWAYGPADEREALRVLDRACELGLTFWDTAELYGPFENERLIGRALRGRARDQVVIATKFGFEYGPDERECGLNSRPAHIRAAVEGSLRRLGVDSIDLYYQHRLDLKTPIEETMLVLAELVHAGKIRHIGLSEVGPQTIRRAHLIHPLTAVQSEYSLWERGVEKRILPTLRELGIGFVAYSPLGRGIFGGKIRSTERLAMNDFRRQNQRFQNANLRHNLQLVDLVNDLAMQNGCTSAQLALAWLLKKGDDIVPIPGTKQRNFLEENARAAEIEILDSIGVCLENQLTGFRTAGSRYSAAALQSIDGAD